MDFKGYCHVGYCAEGMENTLLNMLTKSIGTKNIRALINTGKNMNCLSLKKYKSDENDTTVKKITDTQNKNSPVRTLLFDFLGLKYLLCVYQKWMIPKMKKRPSRIQ